MKQTITLAMSLFFLLIFNVQGQTQQDSLDIKQVALDYIESQHNVNPRQFELAAHPRMVKHTFWANKKQERNILRKHLPML
jgi:hypothetical protein